ncbi:MAG: GerMN domain-containing protein [Desulfobacteraceae bacterium]|nr:GerMN domain-containing protein [Desulfobacteraceae bacterium]
MKRRFSLILFLFLMFSIYFMLFVPSIYCAEDIVDAKRESGQQLFEGFLYFIDKDGRSLRAVKQRFAAGLSPHDLGLEIIEDLIKGHSLKELDPSLPEGTKVNSLFILEDGRAFIDFDQNIGNSWSYSAQSEMLTIYSIVNSLILNIEEINRVKILIQGETAQTLSGHIDLDHFYEANMLIVK